MMTVLDHIGMAQLDKLEQRIFDEINLVRSASTDEELRRSEKENKEVARIAAKICLEVAEKAYNTGFDSGHASHIDYGLGISFEDFKKEIL
jgi:hypothetical protein